MPPTAPDTAHRLVYGTAWKEDATERLVFRALQAGFRAVDTANQRKHYFEAGVGEALRRALGEGLVTRDTLFVQTKFTHRAGQDDRLPYDPRAPVGTQVLQSAASSLEHLGIERIDSYVLHGPSTRHGLAPSDVEAWRAMEQLHDAGTVRALGVSNVSASQLRDLLSLARVRPSVVQNRCYANTGWDRESRALCRSHAVTYQGFSLLTANASVLRSTSVTAPARRLGATPEQVVFAFALAVGMQPLTGTTDPRHLREDLDARALVLSVDEVEAIERVAG